MRILFILFLALVQSTVWSQTGGISGKVIDAKTGDDIIGAIVTIKGTTSGGASDVFGEFKIGSLNAGTYDIECKMASYQIKVISGITVKANEFTSVSIALDEQAYEGQTIEIVDFVKTNTETAVLIEMKEAKSVVSGMSNAQISKSQDRNASEVARRIPGVTIVDNRFVMVRGLSERYNAVLLNGTLAPSLESDAKSFSFDVIPSQAIDRFLIYKSPAPDLPGEFAGGAIQVYTRNYPDARMTLDVSIGSGFRNGTTFKDFKSSVNSKTDWLGYDDGSRALPSEFPANVRDVQDANELQRLGKTLPNTWQYEENKAPLDTRISTLIGNRWKNGNLIVGNYTGINYSQTFTKYISERNDYNVYDEVMQHSDTVFAYNDEMNQKNNNVGLMHNWGIRYKDHNIEWNNFMNQNGQQSNTYREGKAFEEGNFRKEYSFRYTQRLIFSTQLTGTHPVLANKGKFNWTLGYSTTRKSDPDWRRIRYTKPLDGSDENYHAYVPFSAQPFFLGRLFMNLKEEVRTYAGNYEHKLFKTDMKKDQDRFATIKVGTYFENKDRVFSSRNIGYAPASIFQFNYSLDTLGLGDILNENNINTTDGFRIDEDTRGADTYHSSSDLWANYAMLVIPYKAFTISGGVRFERYYQRLNSADITGVPLQANLDSTFALPSANISYQFTEKTLLRAAYGKTVNKPEFREMAPFSFYDFENNFIVSGNPNVQFCTVNNADLRLEHYPNPKELLSFGVFYKEFKSPIEQYFVPGVGSGGTRSFSPGNALSALSYGVEIDLRKSLIDVTNLPILKNIALVANASLIKSDIRLSPEGLETGLNPNRTMVGQSPYIVNAGVYYENDSLGLQISALYNTIGPRVVIVGIPDVPEVYEMPRNLVDIAITKSFKNGFGVRFGIQDIFNQPNTFLQDANADGELSRDSDQILQQYRKGSYYSLSLIYKFKKN